MMDQNASQGWRDSGWNRSREEQRWPMSSRGLALESAVSTRPGGLSFSGPSRRGESSDPAGSVLQFYLAPWFAPVRHRYQTGNRTLMRLLDWVTAKIWPLAVLDETCRWLEEGSLGSRLFLGCSLVGLVAALLSLHWAPMDRLQSMTQPAILGHHAWAILMAAAFLIGIILLPAVLGRLLAVLLRLYVLFTLCATVALLGYGAWLLLSPYAKP